MTMRMRCSFVFLAMMVSMATLAGCKTGPPLPTHPWEGPDAALQTIAQRAERIESLRAGFRLTVQPPEGDRVSVSGALATKRPGWLRAQAWKFDRDVFDLTHRPEDDERSGTWLWLTERAEEERSDAPAFDQNAGDWFTAVMDVPPIDAMRVVTPDDASGPLIVRYPLADRTGWRVELAIHRPTRVITTYRVLDENEREVQIVELSDYQLIDQIALPKRIDARGEWRMTLKLHDIEMNTMMPDALFDPPARAVKQD